MSLKEIAKKNKKENTGVITARIPNSILERFKKHCSELGISVNEAINHLIKTELNGEETEAPEPTQTPIPKKDNIFVIRKTHKIGKPLKDYTTYTKGRVQWSVLAECRAHFDEDGNPIPYRYTDWDGNLVDLDTDDIKEIEEITGMVVEIER